MYLTGGTSVVSSPSDSSAFDAVPDSGLDGGTRVGDGRWPGRSGVRLSLVSPTDTSAQARNSSCGPHPTAPFPSGQTPQLLPAMYFHWITQLVHCKSGREGKFV
uniref:(northern house mosquito) hypothetical protein n=1 Tax=Culex pipiens TaxID=7175 RepID=A0A8D8KR79_CULPI